LAFTRDEMLALLQAHEVTLDDDAADALLARTEGWAAGVQIAALALIGEADPGGFVTRFGDHDRSVADYLIEQVLTRLPGDTRTFMLETSTCREIPVDLAAALSGRNDAGALLELLEQDNVLTLCIDRDATVYRYNELLRTYLQAAMRREDRARHEDLHRMASEWYEQRGAGVLALEHAVAAREWSMVLAWLRSHGVGLLLDHRLNRLSALLQLIPQPWVATPLVQLYRAQLALVAGDIRTADHALAAAEAALHGDDPWLASFHLATTVARARSVGTAAAALTELDSAIPQASEDADLHLLLLHHRGMAKTIVGETAGAMQDLEDAVRLATATERTAVAVSALALSAAVAFETGAYAEMRRRADRALDLAASRGWAGSPISALAHLARATAAYLFVERGEAHVHAELALTALGEEPDHALGLSGNVLHALASAEAGVPPREVLRRVRAAWAAAGEASASLPLHTLFVPAEVQLCLLLGDVAAARTAAARTVDQFPESDAAALVTVQLHMARAQPDLARAILRPLLGGQQSWPTALTLVRLQLLEAERAVRCGEGVRAFDALNAALEVAGESGLLRPFLDAGSTVDELLLVNVGRFGRRESMVSSILAARLPQPEPITLTGRLTDTEMKILLDLPSLATLSEIAEARCVSVNTVKTHLRSVYRKLDVGNRRSAVQEARRCGLL
jgi:LuxR family transcriptional regulator, maltose regulon positive regulatory protein